MENQEQGGHQTGNASDQVMQNKQQKIDKVEPKASQEIDQDDENLPTRKEDQKSVFIENVDYGATKEELQTIFQDCGEIVRVTILKDKFTNMPRGNAYVEFADVYAVDNAIYLSGTKLRNRPIKVQQKRTNLKGMSNSTLNKQQKMLGNFMSSFLGKGMNWRGRGRGR